MSAAWLALSIAAALDGSAARKIEPRPATADELQAVFPDSWRLPAELWHSQEALDAGELLPLTMEQLVESRFDADSSAPAWTRSLGDIVAEARRRGTKRETIDTLLAELSDSNPDAHSRCARILRELLLVDGLYGRKWNGGRDLDDDGLFFGALLERAKIQAAPWSGHKGSRSLHQAAALVRADLEAIKSALNDYPSMRRDPGTSYERIGPKEETFVVAADGARSFAALRIGFRSDLPFPFSHYDCDLGILDTLDAKGRMTTYVFSPSRDFYWFAGQDFHYPLHSSDGEWQGILLVRICGFDLVSVPDGDSDRMEGTRVALGNLKRRSEQAFAAYGGPPRTLRGAAPDFDVLAPVKKRE